MDGTIDDSEGKVVSMKFRGPGDSPLSPHPSLSPLPIIRSREGRRARKGSIYLIIVNHFYTQPLRKISRTDFKIDFFQFLLVRSKCCREFRVLQHRRSKISKILNFYLLEMVCKKRNSAQHLRLKTYSYGIVR